MFDDRPMSILQRLHLEEAHGGLNGLYSLLAVSVKPRQTDAPPAKIHGANIGREDLCTMLGIFVDKLNKMRNIDDKARDRISAAENRAGESLPLKKRRHQQR